MSAITIKKLETQKDQDDAFEIMTGYQRKDIERCQTCSNKATVIVGVREQLWLCDACAASPAFKRYKNLGPIFPWRQQS